MKEEMLRKALADVPKGTLLEERIRLALAMEEMKAIVLKEFPLPLRILDMLVRIINFFGRKKDGD